MRHVVDTSNVAHLWAHQTQDSARNKQGNFYFEGDTIYSYGHHFPIAKHFRGAVLFTTRSYSVTTSGHKSTVRGAIPEAVQVFYVRDPSCNPREIDLDDMQGYIDAQQEKVHAARSRKEWQLVELERQVSHFKRFAAFIGSTREPLTLSDDELQKLAAEARKASVAKRKRDNERRQERHGEWLVELAEWQAGQRGHLSYNPLGTRHAFARREGDELVTTLGARIPVEHARRASELIVTLVERGTAYTPNGHSIHLGAYTVGSISAEGTLTIGCHEFEKAEVLRIAAMIRE